MSKLIVAQLVKQRAIIYKLEIPEFKSSGGQVLLFGTMSVVTTVMSGGCHGDVRVTVGVTVTVTLIIVRVWVGRGVVNVRVT